MSQNYDDEKTYLLKNSIIEDVIQGYTECSNILRHVVSEHPNVKNLAIVIQSIYDKYDELHLALLIELCAYSPKFIERKCKESHLTFNPDEMAAMKSLRNLPEQFGLLHSVNPSNLLGEPKTVFDSITMILLHSFKNFDEIPNELIKEVNDHFEQNAKLVMTQAAQLSSYIPVELREPLETWWKGTVIVKNGFLSYLRLRHEYSSESPQAKSALQQLRNSMRVVIPTSLSSSLNMFRIQIEKALMDVSYKLTWYLAFLANRIGYNPTSVFSDICNLDTTLKIRIQTLEKFRTNIANSNNKRIWLDKLIELLKLFKELLDKVDIRALNLSLDELFKIVASERLSHSKITKILKMTIKQYQKLYIYSILIDDDTVLACIKFNYEHEILTPWTQQIKFMPDNAELDSLLTTAIETFQKNIITEKIDDDVRALNKNYKYAIRTSDELRKKLFEYMVYCSITTPSDNLLSNMENVISDHIDIAEKKIDVERNANTKNNIKILKTSVYNCFFDVKSLPRKIKKIFKNLFEPTQPKK